MSNLESNSFLQRIFTIFAFNIGFECFFYSLAIPQNNQLENNYGYLHSTPKLISVRLFVINE